MGLKSFDDLFARIGEQAGFMLARGYRLTREVYAERLSNAARAGDGNDD